MDKLATVLLGVFMLSTALLVHAAGVANAADEMAASISMSGLLKDLSLAGAAWMYAKTMARDNAVVG
jgi:hypothetical protein